MKIVDEYISKVHEQGLYPNHYIIKQKKQNEVLIEHETSGTEYRATNYGNNDILGLAQHQDVMNAAISAIHQYGTTNSSCATLCGRIDLHRQLEEEISNFKGLPHTYLFLNAWMALQAVMDGFCHLAIPVEGFTHKRETLILTDILNHGCITSAVVNADNRSGKMLTQSPKVRVKAYRHNDIANIRSKLERFAKPGDRIILVTDAVFSMDGDIAPLPELIEVLRPYPGSVLILDEAHSSGAIGKTGKGIFEYFNLSPQDVLDAGLQPVVMTTFSKFAASAGAAISCYSKSFVELIDACPTSIGTISLPPTATAAALEAIRQLRKNPELTAALQENTRYLRQLLAEAGFELMGQTNVVPLILPNGIAPKVFSEHLLAQYGIWVSPVWFIAKPRIRIVVNTLHTKQQLQKLVSSLVEARSFFLEKTV